jgi:hypothetical protein
MENSRKGVLIVLRTDVEHTIYVFNYYKKTGKTTDTVENTNLKE